MAFAIMHFKPEFGNATDTTPPYFIVALDDVHGFIDHLEANGVKVESASNAEAGKRAFVLLQIKAGIPPKDGESLVATFKK